MASSKKKYLRRSALAAAILLVAFCMGSCREIQPEIPQGYKALERPGWPAPQVYDEDPLHPANRWYQRSFAPRDQLGRILEFTEKEDPSPLQNPSQLDRAEIRALLGAIEAAPPMSAESRLRCSRELFAQAEYWSKEAPDLAELHRKTAKGLRPPQKSP